MEGAVRRIVRDPPRLLVEAAAAILALAAAVSGLAHIAASPRALYLFFDGNSVLLELVHRSLAEGYPAHWTMSAALFVVPEIPVYELVRAFAGTPQVAVLANALVYLLAVYVLLRVIAAQLWEGTRATVAGLLAFLVLCLELAYEQTADRDSLELVSDLLFGDYYAGTTVAMLGSVALVVAMLKHSWPRSRWAALGLLLLGVVATASNPLYVLWTSVPLGLALLVLLVGRRATLRSLAVPIAVAVLGPAVGLLVRLPLGRFISAPADRYIHPDGVGDAASFYAGQLTGLLSAGGVGSLLVLLVLSGCSVVVVVLVARRRLGLAAAAAGLFGAVVAPIVLLENVALGTQTVRYLQPLFFGQAVAVVVAVGWMLNAPAVPTAWARLVPSRRRALAVVGALLASALVIGGGVSAASLPATAAARPAGLDCLEDWIDGRELTGAGTFWGVRAAKAYGDESVRLVQVDDELRVDPWLVNLAEYYELDVSYLLLAGHDSAAQTRAMVELLGPPVSVTTCGDYRILDYGGTPGADILSARITDSAVGLARERGFIP